MLKLVGHGHIFKVRISLTVAIFFGICDAIERNVCPTFEDYDTLKNNTNCWYDFTAEFDTVSIPFSVMLN